MQPHSSLTQGLSLLEGAADREQSGRAGYSVSRLADAVGLERSRASRLTQELRGSGYLEIDESQTLRPGPTFFGIAAARNEEWLRASRPALRTLASRFDVSARLSTQSGAGVLLLRYETGVSAPDSSVRPGMTTPVWCTAAGRALLWDLDDTAIATLLQDVEFVGVGGPRAAHSTEEVLSLLGRDRENGHASAVEEFEQGLTELALPLRDRSGPVIAALSVVTRPATQHVQDRMVAELGNASRRLQALVAGG